MFIINNPLVINFACRCHSLILISDILLKIIEGESEREREREREWTTEFEYHTLSSGLNEHNALIIIKLFKTNRNSRH